jgi:hypothetical protein
MLIQWLSKWMLPKAEKRVSIAWHVTQYCEAKAQVMLFVILPGQL